MSVSPADEAGQDRDAPRWYYPWMALIGGAAIIANALLPDEFASGSLVVAALVIGFVGFLARRTAGRWSNHPLTAAKIAYLVVLALVLIGSVVMVWAVVRPESASWLAWVLAALVGLVTLSGAWIMKSGGRTA